MYSLSLSISFSFDLEEFFSFFDGKKLLNFDKLEKFPAFRKSNLLFESLLFCEFSLALL